MLRLVFGHLGIPWEEGVAFDQRWAGAIDNWRENLFEGQSFDVSSIAASTCFGLPVPWMELSHCSFRKRPSRCV